MKQDRGPSSTANNPKLEGHLRDAQLDKEQSARMMYGTRQEFGRKRGERPSAYEHWDRADLYDAAKERGIEAIAEMNKEQLIEALRNR